MMMVFKWQSSSFMAGVARYEQQADCNLFGRDWAAMSDSRLENDMRQLKKYGPVIGFLVQPSHANPRRLG
jgi:hypothetical protein